MANFNLEKEIKEILEEEIRLTNDAVKESLEETGREVSTFLKKTSPQGSRKKRKYSKSWKYEVVKGKLNANLRIYNEQWRLTHLLEFGHIIANQHGKYSGRAKALPHIAPAEEQAIRIFEEKLNNKL